jgi:hypothetical protein
MAALKNLDTELHRTTKILYERTIDLGAHPNERAITGNMTLEAGTDKTTFQNFYLHGDGVPLDHAFKVTAQVGLGSLLMFEHIFRDRFRLLAIDAELQKLRSGL